MSKVVKVSGMVMVLVLISVLIWSTPATVEAVENDISSYEVGGFTVIPGRVVEDLEELEEYEEYVEDLKVEYSEEEEIWVEVVFHVDIPGIKGLVPTSVQAAQSQCPVTEEEILMLAKTLTQECGGITWDNYGVSARARQAAVAWCAFNRVDSPDYPDTLKDVLTYPSAFAYSPYKQEFPEMLELARDVTERWWREKNGEENVGRTLPSTYFFFAGNGKENRFRDMYSWPFNYWDWSLPDPYKD